MKKIKSFEELGLSPDLLEAIAKKGFEEPTPVQEKIIPLMLQSTTDLVGQAQTGTGKTAAFGLPLIETLDPKNTTIQALILTPTRELAIQVAEEINSLKGKKRFHILPVYGGQYIDRQLKSLKQGVQIVVGTPGRVLDHLSRKSINLQHLSYLVLDEADEMLNMGFIEEVEAILEQTTSEKRVLLFSATIPDRILKLAEKHMGTYKIVRIKEEQRTTELADQIYFEVSENDKLEALCRIIDIEKAFYGLIFCRTKVDVDDITNRLIDRGYEAEALHGDLSQPQREKILDKFRLQRISILVATDVAARGLDIVALTHVINYSLPQNPDAYVHRIGRTGRAGVSGTAITFVTPAEYRRMLFIKKFTKADIRKEKIPGIKDVIAQKRLQIKQELEEIMAAGEDATYALLANELLEEHAPGDVISALLKHAYQDVLDVKNYNEIKDISVDNKGTTRLFVALGKKDNMTKQKLVEFIIKKSGVPGRKINDVGVYDQFSFITVPFVEAEIILEVFKSTGKRALVTIATKFEKKKRKKK